MLVQVKARLLPTGDQAAALLATMEAFNAACDAASAVAWDAGRFSKSDLQHACYARLREELGLPAQLAIRAISKVAEAYKLDRTRQLEFEPHGTVTYDERILSAKGVSRVSIATLGGRLVVPFAVGGYETLAGTHRAPRQADLLYRDGTFYLVMLDEYPDGTGGLDAGDWEGVEALPVGFGEDGRVLSVARPRFRCDRGSLDAASPWGMAGFAFTAVPLAGLGLLAVGLGAAGGWAGVAFGVLLASLFLDGSPLLAMLSRESQRRLHRDLFLALLGLGLLAVPLAVAGNGLDWLLALPLSAGGWCLWTGLGDSYAWTPETASERRWFLFLNPVRALAGLPGR